MGNCQAIDNATLLIQHPKGRVYKHYSPVSASEIMKLHPGHYVALLLTTTLYSSAAAAGGATAATTTTASTTTTSLSNNNTPLRVTRIKLLRPNDTLVLGHVYRLVTTKEVMNGLWAKKQAKIKQQKQPGYAERCKMSDKEIDYYEALLRNTEEDNSKQVKHERHRSRNNTAVNSASAVASKSRAWQPSLKSISEAAS